MGPSRGRKPLHVDGADHLKSTHQKLVEAGYTNVEVRNMVSQLPEESPLKENDNNQATTQDTSEAIRTEQGEKQTVELENQKKKKGKARMTLDERFAKELPEEILDETPDCRGKHPSEYEAPTDGYMPDEPISDEEESDSDESTLGEANDPPFVPQNVNLEGIDEIEPEEEFKNNHSSDEETYHNVNCIPPDVNVKGEFVKDPFVDTCDDLFKDEEGAEHVMPRLAVSKLEKGMDWMNAKSARKYLRTYAIQHNFVIKFNKNDKKRIRCVCKDKGCGWVCNLRRVPGQSTMLLRKLVPEHSCCFSSQGKNPMADSRWVADVMFDRFKVQKEDLSPRMIVRDIWKDYKVLVSYWTAWHARDTLLEKLYGSYEESYALLPELCRQLDLCNRGSIVELKTEGDATFKHLCLGFGASFEGFINGCRPLIGLDGCFLKGKYGGCILAAVALDGNNGLFPIAIFICKGENQYTWADFLELIKPKLLLHPVKLTFISDRQKGLIDAVRDKFPGHDHRYCFKHMTKNMIRQHKGKWLENLSWGAAKAYKLSHHEEWMDIIKTENPAALQWLKATAPLDTWSRAHFDESSKCEHISNNFSESFNNWIMDLRSLPVCTLVEKYQLMVMSLIYDRKMKGLKWDADNGIVPRAERLIQGYKDLVGRFSVRGADIHIHLVQHIEHLEEYWRVDLAQRACSCRSWQVTGIPCVHAVCVLYRSRANWIQYTHEFHHVTKYRAAYAGFVDAIPNKKDWEDPTELTKPPEFFRPPGRPRTSRARDEDEEHPNPSKKRRRCRKCGELGHYEKKCKGKPNPAYAKKKRVDNSAPPAWAGGPPSTYTRVKAMEKINAKKNQKQTQSSAAQTQQPTSTQPPPPAPKRNSRRKPSERTTQTTQPPSTPSIPPQGFNTNLRAPMQFQPGSTIIQGSRPFVPPQHAFNQSQWFPTSSSWYPRPTPIWNMPQAHYDAPQQSTYRPGFAAWFECGRNATIPQVPRPTQGHPLPRPRTIPVPAAPAPGPTQVHQDPMPQHREFIRHPNNELFRHIQDNDGGSTASIHFRQGQRPPSQVFRPIVKGGGGGLGGNGTGAGAD